MEYEKISDIIFKKCQNFTPSQVYELAVTPGLKNLPKCLTKKSNPVEYFQLIVPDNYLTTICDYTNKYFALRS